MSLPRSKWREWSGWWRNVVNFGIHGIHFFASKNSERKEIKLQRLEKTAISALKQSKNLYLPEITGLHTLKEVAAKEGGEKNYSLLFRILLCLSLAKNRL